MTFFHIFSNIIPIPILFLPYSKLIHHILCLGEQSFKVFSTTEDSEITEIKQNDKKANS